MGEVGWWAQWVNIDLAGYLISQRWPLGVQSLTLKGMESLFPPLRKLVVLKPTL